MISWDNRNWVVDGPFRYSSPHVLNEQIMGKLFSKFRYSSPHVLNEQIMGKSFSKFKCPKTEIRLHTSSPEKESFKCKVEPLYTVPLYTLIHRASSFPKIFAVRSCCARSVIYRSLFYRDSFSPISHRPLSHESIFYIMWGDSESAFENTSI